MKTNQFFLIILMLSFGLTKAQNVNIPDSNFKEFLLGKTAKDLNGISTAIDANKDGEIQISEAENISDLNLSYCEAASLVGIEGFVNLTELFCTNNKNITSLDVSSLSKLKTLHCKTNQKLETLTLGNLTQLNNFTCSYNDKITSLDLSGLNALTIFEIAGSAMTSLDISSLKNLTNFGCLNTNNLTSANLSGLTKLKSIDFNGNKKITSLDLSGLTSLNRFYAWSNITLTNLNLSGLSNLTELNIQSNSVLTQLDLGDLNQLNKFWCQYNPLLTAITFDGQVNLKEFNLRSNVSLMNLDLSDLTKLDDFIFWGNNTITNLDVSNSKELTNLDVQGNEGLQSIDVSGLKKLDDFECKNNDVLSSINTTGTELNYLYFEDNKAFTNLNLSNFTRLNQLYCAENEKLESIDFSNLSDLHTITSFNNDALASLQLNNLTGLTTLEFNDNDAFISLNLSDLSGLESLTCNQNNSLTNLNIRNGSVFEYIGLSELPNLQYICVDGEELNEVKTIIKEAEINAEINTYCSFQPGGKFNTISGKVSYDEEGNGCDNDEGILDLKLKIDNGTSYKYVYTNQSGAYTYYNKNSGNYTVTPQFDNPYFTCTPPSKEIVFTGGDESVAQSFCVTYESNKNDLEIRIIPVVGARPGFDAEYKIVYHNKGTTTISGAVDFKYDETVIDYVSASETPIKKSGKLTFNYTDLKPFESRSVTVILNINSPMELPAVIGGDKLSFAATIDPITNDETPKDNTFTFVDNVVNSFDPNDKTCIQGATITPEMVGEFVDYLIRFENTGTAEAINIVVKDIIDTNVFDINTLTMVGASHEYELRITDTNKVEFIFEGINLPFPPSELRHGYIAFKIKTKATVALGDQLKNKADIYFDFNFPIITNEYVTTVAIKSLNTEKFNKNEQTAVSFYPNPAEDRITFEKNVQSVQIYNLNGKLLRHSIVNGTRLDISELTRGVYLLKIENENGLATEKLIKL